MDPLDHVALLQIAVLQQYLLERDVEQARRRNIRRRRPRRYQTRPWLSEERRRLYGHYTRLLEELRVEDPQSFFNYLRMEPAMFDELVQRVGPRIEKQDTKMRKALPPGLKLAITVGFLASGDKYPQPHVHLPCGKEHRQPHHPWSLPSHCGGVQGWGHHLPHHSRRMDTYWGLQKQVEYSSCCGSSRWQACGHQETCQEWLIVPQLQGILLCGPHGPCGCRI